MKKQDFFKQLEEDLEIESTKLSEQTHFRALPEFTSISVLGLIAFVDNYFEKKITAVEIQKLTTIRSLMEYIGIESFE